MQPIKLFSPSQVLHPGEEGPVDFSSYTLKFLAQGDSWFSFGSAVPWATGNLLNPLQLAQSACAVNCAVPGKKLSHMVDSRREPAFINLLIGQFEMPWSGILLSGGGNDLIDAIRTPPVDGDGAPVEQARRLLLKPEERGVPSNVDGYISEAGWQTFQDYLVPQFHEFVAMRDDLRSQSKGVPVFAHTYDFVTPRNAGAGFNHGPWLYPALTAYDVPTGDWAALARTFMLRLRGLMLRLNLPGLHVVTTEGTLVPAAYGSTGESNDWENEIHPTPDGYSKLAKVLSSAINDVFRTPVA